MSNQILFEITQEKTEFVRLSQIQYDNYPQILTAVENSTCVKSIYFSITSIDQNSERYIDGIVSIITNNQYLQEITIYLSSFCCNLYKIMHALCHKKIITRIIISHLRINMSNEYCAEQCQILINLFRSIDSNISLSYLRMKDIYIEANIIGEIVQILKNNCILSLSLSNNSLPKNIFSDLINTLQYNSSITDLNIWSNNLNGVASNFALYLKSNTTLRKLHIDFCNLSLESTVLITDAIASNLHLEYVFISVNPGSKISIYELLATNHTLKSLYLTTNTHKYYPMHADHIDKLTINNNLQNVGFIGYNFDLDNINGICKILEVNINLTELFLADNRFKPDTIKQLCSALQHNIKLSRLTFKCCNLSACDVECIASMLSINCDLRYLNIRDNMDDELLSIIIEAVSNSCIDELYIERNNTEEKSIMAIARLLSTNHTLSTLKIFTNYTRGSDIIPIITALSHNTNLTDLSTDGNIFGPDVLASFLMPLQLNYTLTKLDIGYDDCETYRNVKHIIQRNRELFYQRRFTNTKSITTCI